MGQDSKKKTQERKQRSYKKVKKQERARLAAADADTRRVELLAADLTIKQLEAISNADRPDDWQAQYDDAKAEKAKLQREIDATNAKAEKLNGKPFTDEEKRARDKAVKDAKIERLDSQITVWEQTMLSHELNLDRLEAIPEDQRDDQWYADWESNERDLDVLERAVTVAQTELDAARA